MAMYFQTWTALWAQLALLASILTLGLAGRAFPQETENFVQDLFRKINPSIEWDPTNFLIDLSGRYAICRSSRKRGTIRIDDWTMEDGASIGGLHDHTPGALSHVGAVKVYLRNALPLWLDRSPFKEQIQAAKKFGCSVQPRCKGSAIFTCLFSPAYAVRPKPTPKPDVDECIRNNGGCQHICRNTVGSYYCSCFQGYSLQPDRHSCSADDVDECYRHNGGCDHICHNTLSSFYCSCRAGYTLQADRRTCRDQNECLRDNGGCQHICHNTVGSFYCSCRAGFTLQADRSSCRDVDECANGNGGCQHICHNTIGSYYCSCRSGYTLQADQHSCDQIPTRPPKPEGIQKALAFTRQEYNLAEGVTGTTWDDSHFLENLSGYETDCTMIGKSSWAFSYAKAKGKLWDYDVDGLFGSTPNLDDTSGAIIKVLKSWDRIPTKEVGCSVIPGCPVGSQQYVVVSCIFRVPPEGADESEGFFIYRNN